jgi:phosphoribosyl-AMP cyclohydrolase
LFPGAGGAPEELADRHMDFSKLDGLIPAVVQDDRTGEVLMVGFMNEEALSRTRDTGFATFFSRTRGALWTKGETSGNRLEVKRILIDCDDDTVLLKVVPLGDGVACHTGERSCFYRQLGDRGPQTPGLAPQGAR